MKFNRQTALRSWAKAKAAAADPNTPQQAKDLYQKGAEHLQVALGLGTALDNKMNRDSQNQSPMEQAQQDMSKGSPLGL